MKRAVLSLSLLLFAASVHAEDTEARGDRLWARRAEGFAATQKADPEIAAGAVQAYEEALRTRPRDLALRFKLVEALYFAGHFADRSSEVARKRFERAVEVSEEACSIAGEAGPQAVEAHFWAAISWGLWGMSHSTLAAAMHDVAGKIRDHASRVAALAPGYRDAAGWRILGRLHVQVPYIPMITGWVSRDDGIAFLRKAQAASDRDPRNPLFLAEALLAERPQKREQALALLREVAARTPRPELLVEDTEMVTEARRELAKAQQEAG